MIKNALIKLWREPNPWMAGVAFLYITTSTIASIIKGVAWLVGQLITVKYLLPIGVLFLFISFCVLIRKILSYKTIPFEGQSILANFAPTFYLLSWWKGRDFRTVHIDNEFPFFNDAGARIFSIETPAFLSKTGLKVSRPIIIFRVPVRDFMPIPDFINLHLVHRLSLAGARVIIILTDVLYSDKRILQSDVDFTMNICKKALGNFVEIHRLSAILESNCLEFTRFVLEHYIPFLAVNDKKLTDFKQAQANDKSDKLRANSFLSFGVLAFAIPKLLKKKDNVFVMQWKERIDKWHAYLSLIENTPDFIIKGVIVNENVMDYNGESIVTGSHIQHVSPLFTMTDDPDYVIGVVFKYEEVEGKIQWEVPQAYMTWLNKVVFGIDGIDKSYTGLGWYKKWRLNSRAKSFIRDTKVRELIVSNRWDEFYSRALFCEKFSASRKLFGNLYL